MMSDGAQDHSLMGTHGGCAGILAEYPDNDIIIEHRKYSHVSQLSITCLFLLVLLFNINNLAGRTYRFSL